jgi:acyl carrier protein
VEEILAGIWQELLRVERVGRNDNFFELGGHSLIGTRLVAAVRDRLAASLPVTAVFQYPNPRAMAEAVGLLRKLGDPDLSEQEGEYEEGALELSLGSFEQVNRGRVADPGPAA